MHAKIYDKMIADAKRRDSVPYRDETRCCSEWQRKNHTHRKHDKKTEMQI